MTWTWVSVGSGKASTVRSRKASQPQIATTAVRASTAALFFREKSTSAWNNSVLQHELVEEKDGALAHVAAPGLQPAPVPAGSHRHPLELPLAARDEDHRALPVGDHRLGGHADALLGRVGLELDVHEGVGTEGAVVVGRADAQLHRSPLRVHHLGDAL